MRQLFLDSVSVDEARRRWLSNFGDQEFPKETVAVREAQGRILAEPVYAIRSSPHYAASAMDGFAVDSRLTKEALPGKPLRIAFGEGCVQIDTGDPLPPGTDSVVMIEHVLLEEDSISIEQAVPPWHNVRPVGEDIIAHEMLLPRASVIGAAEAAACLAAGVDSVEVQRRPVVAVIPSGDEIIPPGTYAAPGQIVDTNSTMVAMMLTEWGASAIITPIVSDEQRSLSSAISNALSSSDLAIVLAGSSAGRGDYTADAVRELGSVLVHGVAMRPGKPVIMGRVGDKPVLGLPGYPVSAHLCMREFVHPLLARWHPGREGSTHQGAVDARLSRSAVSPSGLREHVRVRLGIVEGRLIATPLGRGAGILTSIVRSDGELVIPPSSEGHASQETVTVQISRSLVDIKERLSVTGSHDLVLDVLDDLLRSRRSGKLASAHVGSMGGLLALRSGECHGATIHLLDADSGVYNIPFVKRYLAGMDVVLIRVVRRSQGFMYVPKTPRQVRWEDLCRVRFVNRQRGSGTRLLLDYHLQQAGIEAGLIDGYEREEMTHLAVACAIASGEAEIGLGVQSAALVMGLAFEPVAYEDYDLVISRNMLANPVVTELLSILRSEEFADRMQRMGGYSTESSGQIVWENHHD